jgi:NitT/TauT family transport system ATP-binding protein
VRDNVVFGPRHRREPKADYLQRASELIGAVGLAGWEHHYPYQLSGGMRQRVQLARALINRPAVLLMDEPFGALDAQTRSRMQELLLGIWTAYHPTVLIVTHDVEEALLVAHRVYVMTRAPGRIKDCLTVPFGHPRAVDLVGTAEFAALKYSVVKSLWEENARGAPSSSSPCSPSSPPSPRMPSRRRRSRSASPGSPTTRCCSTRRAT